MRTYGAALGQHRTTIDRLNVYPVPDGDTGTNMAMTLAAVSDALPQSGACRAEVCHAISHGALMGARGNSGVIVSQLLRGFASAVAPGDDLGAVEPPITAASVASGLAAASAAADSAVMRPVEGTILSVARVSAQAAQRKLDTLAADGRSGDADGLVAVLESAKAAGQQALEATPMQLPVLAEAGVVDAGAAGYLLFLDALLCVVDGRPLPSEVDLPTDVAAAIAAGAAGWRLTSDAPDAASAQRAALHRHLPDGGDHGMHDPSSTRYEVMFLLAAAEENIEPFKAAWDALGDSMVMVGGDGLWNCHIHTDHIGPVIEAGIDAGRPHRIQITDLHEQVAGLQGTGIDTTGPDATLLDRPQVRCAVVAVSPAPGLDELFTSLGAQQIVTGGQTMNPSTAELLAAVEAAPATEVVVLPNNANIVAAARQADAQTAKHVEVVATESLPAGLAALVGYDPSVEAGRNAVLMAEAASAVAAGEVTRAVRSVTASIGHVAAGQWIGLDGSGIVAAGEQAADAAIGLLEHLLAPEHEIVSLIEGAGAQPSETAGIESWLSQHWPDVALERHVGGQDHYRYLVGVE